MQTISEAKGLYRRKLTWWFRFSQEGKQHRINLRTHDFSEAVKEAAKIRREGVHHPVLGKKVWNEAINDYLNQKARMGHFRQGTVGRVRSCLTTFVQRSGVVSPSDVKLQDLQSYYNSRRKKSEAGARSTMATIQAFLREIDCLPGRVTYAPGSRAERREATLSISTANKWIDATENDQLRFILFAGFHAGMRTGEIRHCRAGWFDLTGRLLSIPAKETQTLPNKQRTLWESKDRETRTIPLSEPFWSFLLEFLHNRPGHCLRGRRSKNGLYDFRLPFARFAQKMGQPEITPHSMRHSWISELCNSGNHSIQEVAAWSGDTLQTIERNYWHKKAEAGALDETVAGVRKTENLVKDISKILRLLESGKITKEEIEEGLWEHAIR